MRCGGGRPSAEARASFDPLVLTHVAERDDLREATPEALGNAYVCALDAKARAETGRHYTPAALAEAMWQQTLVTLGGDHRGLVLDPACGTGALLVPQLPAEPSPLVGVGLADPVEQVVDVGFRRRRNPLGDAALQHPGCVDDIAGAHPCGRGGIEDRRHDRVEEGGCRP